MQMLIQQKQCKYKRTKTSRITVLNFQKLYYISNIIQGGATETDPYHIEIFSECNQSNI